MLIIDSILGNRTFSSDYFEVLGVSRESTDRQVKQAYRELALKYHPDKCKGESQDCSQRFTQVRVSIGVCVCVRVYVCK